MKSARWGCKVKVFECIHLVYNQVQADQLAHVRHDDDDTHSNHGNHISHLAISKPCNATQLGSPLKMCLVLLIKCNATNVTLLHMLQGMLKPMMMKGIMVLCVFAPKRSKVNRMFECRGRRGVKMLLSSLCADVESGPDSICPRVRLRPRHVTMISGRLRCSNRRHRLGQYSPAPP
jgi:hypothetical protein